MKLALQLAYKNLMGSGLRTWLNVIVLSFSFVMIIFFNGLMDGWNKQATQDTIAWEYGNGHVLHENYDPYDPFTIQDAHGTIPENENLVPILINQGSIYPDGRMISVLLKGIDVNQTTLAIPTDKLKNTEVSFPAVIGKRMAESSKLSVGDEVLLRWRDKNGTYDATIITIVEIFDNNVPSVDGGQIWISLDKMWDITGLTNEATMLVANEDYTHDKLDGWKFVPLKELTALLDEMVATKKISSSILYILLLSIALLAIFDTQVLSIFRRQKEIGTYVALGMTRWQVVGLFTVEGAMYSILAAIAGAIYGVPLFIYLTINGMAFPQANQDMGIAMAERMFPLYSFQLIVGTIILVVLSATIVSFLPARKIAKMDPVAALKGKLQ